MAKAQTVVSESVELWLTESQGSLAGLDAVKGAFLGGMPEYINQALWPTCPLTGQAMHFICQLPLNWLPLRRQNLWNTSTLYVFYSFASGLGEAFAQSKEDFIYGPALQASYQRLRSRILPKALPRFSLAYLYKSMRKNVNSEKMRGCIGVIGDHPRWNYESETPACSGCGRRNSFLLRLFSLRATIGQWIMKFGGGGGIWLTVCEHCDGGVGRAAIDPRFHVVTQSPRQQKTHSADIDFTEIEEKDFGLKLDENETSLSLPLIKKGSQGIFSSEQGRQPEPEPFQEEEATHSGETITEHQTPTLRYPKKTLRRFFRKK